MLYEPKHQTFISTVLNVSVGYSCLSILFILGTRSIVKDKCSHFKWVATCLYEQAL